MTYQLGAVAFVDSGAAWFEGATPAPLHAVGVGLRWLLPQFNHRLMRLDLAAPVDALQRPRLVFSFDQAF
jgi:outer membrane translocation and assembly module TamA